MHTKPTVSLDSRKSTASHANEHGKPVTPAKPKTAWALSPPGSWQTLDYLVQSFTG